MVNNKAVGNSMVPEYMPHSVIFFCGLAKKTAPDLRSGFSM